MSKKFINPFASQGQTSAVPEDIQPSGDVSWQEGFGADYAKDYGDPTSKDIDRQQLNKILLDITDAIAEMQKHGVDTWSALVTYPIGALVWYGNVLYQALAISTGNAPPHADWAAIGTAATATLTTSNADATPGRVLRVGDGGWMGASTPNGYMIGYPQSLAESISQIYRRDESDGPVDAYAVSIHMASGNTWSRLRSSPFSAKAWIQGGSSADGTGWTEELYHTGNFNPDSKTNTSTQVIAGAGLSGGGNLAANRTLSIAASHIPLGVGQTWQDVASSRFENMTYTNNTGRPIYISIAITDIGAGTGALRVNGIVVGNVGIGSTEYPVHGTISAIVPHLSTYILDLGNAQSIVAWAELR